MLLKIRDTQNPGKDLLELLDLLHTEGAKDSRSLENLSYFKEFHPTIFSEFEEKIISALGLFYKIETHESLYSFLMAGIGRQHIIDYGANLTPVQASIRRALDNYQYTSISAPTSAGKSYSIRDFIVQGTGDAVIVVPSRALIAEYMNAMQRRFKGNKGVMITSFVDIVYESRTLRRIFVLTPERCKDLYKVKEKLNVQTFFFDEAQISEEERRGVVFDVTVRRVQKHFPSSKIIFAHPFVENPDAQFDKHNINSEGTFSKSYEYGSVGKICVFQHQNGKHYYFSPYNDKGYLIKNCLEFKGSFKEFVISTKRSILVYVSKSSIYRGDFTDDFQDYINSLPQLTDTTALEIVQNIQHILGADNSDHKSYLVELLKKGVVIHHGSIPLEVRFLIEDFIRKGYASLCFATSTLAQGINMPFDIVWLDNNRFDGNESDRSLGFKNLIGRSGRLTDKPKFDYGYVYTTNPKLFSERIGKTYKLEHQSVLNRPISSKEADERETIEAIQNDTFDDNKNIPLSKVQRLSEPSVLQHAKFFLDIIYRVPDDIVQSIGGATNRKHRKEAKDHLQAIYEASLGRPMFDGELNVFNNAIAIFLHSAQGRSFREIVSIRYNYITARDDQNIVEAQFSQPAKKLPDSTLQNAYSMFKIGTPVDNVSYDAVVFDTYDYMDQVISFSLSDVFIAAFTIYNEHFRDDRSDKIIEIFKYGTNNQLHILLLRYGFAPEIISDLVPLIQEINSERILFNSSFAVSSPRLREIIEWYLP